MLCCQALPGVAPANHFADCPSVQIASIFDNHLAQHAGFAHASSLLTVLSDIRETASADQPEQPTCKLQALRKYSNHQQLVLFSEAKSQGKGSESQEQPNHEAACVCPSEQGDSAVH